MRLRLTGTAAPRQSPGFPRRLRAAVFVLLGTLCLFSALRLDAQEREPSRSLDDVDRLLEAPATIRPRAPDTLAPAPPPEPVAPAQTAPSAPVAGVPAVPERTGPEFLPPASIDDLLADAPTAYDPAQAPTLGMLEGTWRELLVALRGGRLSAAAPLFNQLERLRFLLGIDSMPPRSTALIQMAEQAAKNGDRDLMRTLLDEAGRLSSRLAAVAYARFRIALDLGEFEPPNLAGWFREGVKIQLGLINTYLAATATLLQALGYAIQLASLAIALVLLYRTHMAIASDFAHWFRGIDQIPFWVFRLFVVLVALVPVALGAGTIGTAAVWLLLSAMYLTNRESAVLFASLAGLAAAPYLAEAASERAITARSVQLTSVVNARYSEPTVSLFHLLEQRVAEVPSDEASRFSLGMVALKRRNLEVARQSFSEVLRKTPGFWQAAANLAVVEALDGNPEAGLARLDEASRSAGGSKWLQFNRGRILELMGPARAAEAQAALQAAKKDLGRDVWDLWTRPLTGTGELALFAAFPLSDRYIWEHRAEFLEGSRDSVKALFEAYSGGSGEVTVLVLLCAAGVLAIQLLRRRIGHSYVCESCGTWIRARQGQFLQSTSLCAQCIAVLYRNETVDPAVLLKKRAEIKSFQRRKRQLWSLATFVAPGSGEMGRGRLVIGALFLALTSVLVIFWLQGGIVTGDPWSLKRDPSLPFRATLIVGGLLFYLSALWHFFNLEEGG